MANLAKQEESIYIADIYDLVTPIHRNASNSL
jgi:hypothetical protein